MDETDVCQACASLPLTFILSLPRDAALPASDVARSACCCCYTNVGRSGCYRLHPRLRALRHAFGSQRAKTRPEKGAADQPRNIAAPVHLFSKCPWNLGTGASIGSPILLSTPVSGNKQRKFSPSSSSTPPSSPFTSAQTHRHHLTASHSSSKVSVAPLPFDLDFDHSQLLHFQPWAAAPYRSKAIHTSFLIFLIRKQGGQARPGAIATTSASVTLLLKHSASCCSCLQRSIQLQCHRLRSRSLLSLCKSVSESPHHRSAHNSRCPPTIGYRSCSLRTVRA